MEETVPGFQKIQGLILWRVIVWNLSCVNELGESVGGDYEFLMIRFSLVLKRPLPWKRGLPLYDSIL